MVTLNQLVSYYQGLLAFQYKDRPKARETIGLFAKQAVGDNLITDVSNAFTIPTALGKQLDTIGKYVGVPRTIALAVNDEYFGFWRYTITDPLEQNPNGFLRYEGTTTTTIADGDTVTIAEGQVAQFSAPKIIDGYLVLDGILEEVDGYVEEGPKFYEYGFTGMNLYDLPDQEYKLVLRLKIILNSSDGTLASIQRYLNTFFPGSVTVVDNQDMTLTYTVSSGLPISLDVLTAYLPRPMGVSITVNTVL